MTKCREIDEAFELLMSVEMQAKFFPVIVAIQKKLTLASAYSESVAAENQELRNKLEKYENQVEMKIDCNDLDPRSIDLSVHGGTLPDKELTLE